MLGKVLVIACMLVGAFCNECTVNPVVYFTTEAALSAEAVVSTTFSVRCNSKPYADAVYVEWNGKIIPAAKDSNGNFQASFTEDHAKFSTGSHTIRVFDENGFSSFRKAVRTGESVTAIKALGSINFDNKGVWKGPMVRSDLVALLIVGVALFLAHHQKSKI